MSNVIVYSADSCPWCKKVKEYLQTKNVEFTEKDVSADHDAAVEMVQKSGQQGIPVVDIDGKIIVGFNQAEIDKSLEGS